MPKRHALMFVLRPYQTDAVAAREHSRRRDAWLRKQKELLDLEGRLSAAAVADLLPDVADEDMEPSPEPTRVVRMVGGLAAAPAPVTNGDTFMDRYAVALERQRPPSTHLRAVE